MMNDFFIMRKNPLILVVDDISENLRLLGNILKEAEYSIAIASNGQQAINIAKSKKPDLILLDVQMPEMDGFTVCSILKKDNETNSIPILFLTAKNDTEDILKGFDCGALDFITKPFNQKELLARVKTHVELKFIREKLEKMSFYDDLVGIPNKRFFNHFFEKEWQHSLSEKVPLSLLMIDIDYFKSYNDTYGHLAGDICLHKIGKTIESIIENSSDFAARWGGEEFVVVLMNSDEAMALSIAEKIRESIRNLNIPHENSNADEFVTISVGVASIIPETESEITTFVANADKALYESKSSGRNKVTVYKK